MIYMYTCTDMYTLPSMCGSRNTNCGGLCLFSCLSNLKVDCFWFKIARVLMTVDRKFVVVTLKTTCDTDSTPMYK